VSIEKAQVLLERGDPIGAKNLLRRILLKTPRHRNALYLLSVIEAKCGNAQGALDVLNRLISVDPQNAAAHYTKANILLSQGMHLDALPHHDVAVKLLASNPWALINRGISRASLKDFSGAIEDFNKAIDLDSSLSPAFGNKGNAFLETNLLEQSLQFLDRAIELDPFNVDALSSKSACLTKLKKPSEALIYAARSIELKPDFAKAWNNHGNALNDLKRHEEALTSYDRSTVLKPDYAEAWYNRGIALNDLKRHEEALTSYDRSIELKPDYVEAWLNRGIALNDLKRHEEALTSYDRSLELRPDYAEAWNNHGNALNDLKRHEEALTSYERSLELRPDFAEAWSSRGAALGDLRRHEEAQASYEKSIELKPDYAEAIFNKGCLQLTQKDFLNGFENYLWRWKTKDYSGSSLKTFVPLCNPTIRGKNILLWAEQGIGDEIFYAGFLTEAQGKYSSISLVADIRLHPIFARSLPKIALLDRSQAKAPESFAAIDFQAPIADLGHLLGLSFDKIKQTRRPFLVADQRKTAAFKSNAPFTNGKFVCGLAWSSHNKRFGDAKSIDLKQLEPILRNPRLDFINLQYGKVDSEIEEVESRFGVKIHQIKGLDVYNDIDDLLALINACDLVITTSNVTAHLAGSIGKKGCVVVPFSNGRFWYWHLDDVYSFWYPSLRVFYQSDRHNWSATISCVQRWLERAL